MCVCVCEGEKACHYQEHPVKLQKRERGREGGREEGREREGGSTIQRTNHDMNHYVCYSLLIYSGATVASLRVHSFC